MARRAFRCFDAEHVWLSARRPDGGLPTGLEFPHAYVGLMRSGLPVWWVPCFDGELWQNRGHASFWKAPHRDLLRDVSPAVRQYFTYALEHEKPNPLSFLSEAADAALPSVMTFVVCGSTEFLRPSRPSSAPRARVPSPGSASLGVRLIFRFDNHL